jgi:putative DNA modification/repair radical SAM protein
MELLAKLEILAAGARYDVSCASSGSRRGSQGGVGNGAVCGVCHSWTADGRCVSLLKILLSNQCIFDCAYCVNRRSHDTRRVMLTPEEVADLTIGFYRRNYIEGLFLSTGVVRDPDYTMELLIAAARRLREIHRFNGYIHLKMVPGADPLLVAEAGRHADRLSVNIELPTRQSLALLAPDKSRETVLTPMRTVAGLIAANQEERRILRKTPPFAPAGAKHPDDRRRDTGQRPADHPTCRGALSPARLETSLLFGVHSGSRRRGYARREPAANASGAPPLPGRLAHALLRFCRS